MIIIKRQALHELEAIVCFVVSLRLEEVACNANALRLKFPTIIAERATIQV